MNFFKYLLNRFQKPIYKLEGECRQCGECCKNIYCVDTYSITDFKITQFIYPQFKRFKPVKIDTTGNLILECTLLSSDNKCTVYDNRLKMCKMYPNILYGSLGHLPEHCGYKLVPIVPFENLLER